MSEAAARYHLHGTDGEDGVPRRRLRLWWAASLLLIGVGVGVRYSAADQVAAAPTTTQAGACSNGFPPAFIWGLGTSAYQIEGGVNLTGRQPSIWDGFAHTPGKTSNGDTGDVACDHVRLFRSDVELMRSIGLRHYRFSISWSRVMSWDAARRRMVPNEPGLRFYDALLDALLVAGITPYVTLYHWDLPQALHTELGGWHTPYNARMHAEFARYAALCFGRYGGRVLFWATFNEPWTFAVEGYSLGQKAPGCVPTLTGPGPCPDGDAVYVVGHNVLLAHAAAAEVYRREYQPSQRGLISMSLNCEFSLPLTPAREDVAAAERANEFYLGWWLQPLLSGDYPVVMRQYLGARLPTFSRAQSARLQGSIDVLGLNHYSTHLVRAARPREQGDQWCGWIADQQLYSSYGAGWPQAASAWERAYPPGIRLLLNWAAGRAGARWHGDVLITENGWGCNSAGAAAAARDAQQREYLTNYTEQVRLALIEDGVPVRGYFGWSLLDNFEWNDGYSKRFGLFYVDYETQVRTPKLAARWWNRTRHCSAENRDGISPS